MRRIYCSYIVALALVAAPGCASSGALQTTTHTAHVTVLTVHTLVDVEAKAFAAAAYDNDHHQLYVQVLLKLAQSERVLNDALHTWNATQGAPMPTVVVEAIYSLGILSQDLQPLAGNTAIGPFLNALSAALATLKGGA